MNVFACRRGMGAGGGQQMCSAACRERGDALYGCKLSVSLKPAALSLSLYLSLSLPLYGRVIPSAKMCAGVNVHFLVFVCACAFLPVCARLCQNMMAALPILPVHSWSIKRAKRKNNLFSNGKLFKLFTAESLVNKRAWLLIFA